MDMEIVNDVGGLSESIISVISVRMNSMRSLMKKIILWVSGLRNTSMEGYNTTMREEKFLKIFKRHLRRARRKRFIKDRMLTELKNKRCPFACSACCPKFGIRPTGCNGYNSRCSGFYLSISHPSTDYYREAQNTNPKLFGKMIAILEEMKWK